MFPKPDPNERLRPARDILQSDGAEHARMRKLLTHCFSDKALRDQEPIVMEYINLLITKLTEKAKLGIPCDMGAYYNFTTFDIMADLAFGEPFHALEKAAFNPFMTTLFGTMKLFGTMGAIGLTPVLSQLLALVAYVTNAGKEQRQQFQQHAKDLVARRQAKQTDKQDFFSHIIRHNDDRGLSQIELEANSEILVAAGSETSATALSGITYHLIKNPDCHIKIQDEVRSKFKTSSEITPTAALQLPYLRAVIEESMRIHPSAPGPLPRETMETEIIDGVVIPPHTHVSIANYAAFHSADYFRDPEVFAPERWMGDEKYKDDVRASFQPFSQGPRNCIGRR
jgi:cytochrome P450